MRGVEGAAPYVAAANRDACVEGDAHIDPIFSFLKMKKPVDFSLSL